ncbi:prolyl endopeptidase-like [Leptopilina heterotoma]|uniref:prolyl endopeptidase-like n=1 Tax=Leptopilina heterotoma TaxID=63436 RepID=UPI001CA7B6C0|nr:prolyl endopeptidase-like [Leptopilina heterotoma]
MRFLTNFLFSILSITLISGKSIETIFPTEAANFNYPEARRDNVVNNYHGVKISDPYRWLENSKSEETANFIEAQNSLTDSYLNSPSSVKKSIENRLKELGEKSTHHTNPERHGDKYYFVKNGVSYVQETLESGEPKVFIDPKNFSTNNKTLFHPLTKFSEDGSVVAYTFIENKTTDFDIRRDIHFMNAETGEKYSDILQGVEFFSAVWTRGNLGIFYNYSPQKNSRRKIEEDVKVYYHKIGTSQSEDIVVVDFPDEKPQKIYTDVSNCVQWLFVSKKSATGKNSLYFTELTEEINGIFNLTEIIVETDSRYVYIGNDGTKGIFRTNLNAPKWKVIAIDVLNYKQENWTTLVSEESDKIIRDVTIVDNDKFVIQYYCDRACVSCDTDYILQLHSLESGRLIKKLQVGFGTILMTKYGNRKHPDYFFSFTSFLIPKIIYRVNVNSFDKPEIYYESKVKNFDPSLYEIFRIFYPSKDGTQIPMTIVMRKGAKLDRSMPALLSINGGITISSFYHDENVIFTQNFNGILAKPQIRGSEESNDKWHKDGILQNRQNGIDDFQSAAEYLIKNGYTSREKLTIRGDVAGGLIVGACINQRPNLFGAALISNGIFDTLRFHKFTSSDYLIFTFGNSDRRQDFENLIKLSPLHNVKVPKNNEQYPATLLTAYDYAGYVDPLHSLKFTATLQNKIGNLKQQKNPLLFKINTSSKYDQSQGLMEKTTALLTFIAKSLNLELNF